MNEKQKKTGIVQDDKIILIKPYKVDDHTTSTLLKSLSFIDKEIDNLIKYMKFVKFSTQTRIFQPPLYYQSLWSRGEQDSDFWKEVVIVLVNNKHNTETSRNGYLINMFQEEPPYELFFIAINNQGQVIISPNKKMVATYIIEELEVLIWFIFLWILKTEYYYD